jgi:DNA-binding NarL/FixJ family response regulator
MPGACASNMPPTMAARGGAFMTTRILIADDHEVVLSGLRNFLESQQHLVVVGEARDGREAVGRALETSPDIALLDYSMPVMNGVEAARRIKAQLPRTEVLIFTMHHSDRLIGELDQAGVRGYLLKSDAKRHLMAAIEALAMRKTYYSPCVGEEREARQADPGPPLPVLTIRERHVVQLIAEGFTNKRIAQELGISPKTVETHRATVMRKLTLSSSAALVRYAVRNGYLHA